MALIMARETNIGINLESAYVKIENTSGNKSVQHITVLIFVSEDARENGNHPIEQHAYSFVPSVEDDAPNYHKQGYEYIKTLPEFEGAMDC